MNRNRLDEIVDEEIGKAMWASGADKIVARYVGTIIGDRLFRHGVERACGSWPAWESVQPAPAEEKNGVYDSGSDYKGVAWKWQDRRKGQRRHAQLYVRAARYGQPQDDGWWEQYPPKDRRSGKDRRKV